MKKREGEKIKNSSSPLLSSYFFILICNLLAQVGRKVAKMEETLAGMSHNFVYFRFLDFNLKLLVPFCRRGGDARRKTLLCEQRIIQNQLAGSEGCIQAFGQRGVRKYRERREW